MSDPVFRAVVLSRLRLQRVLAEFTTRSAGIGCHVWTGAKFEGGYGQVRVKVEGQWRGFGTHRVAWMLSRGPIPTGVCVCHQCDNPSCCNPTHLFLGSHVENMRDRGRKRRAHTPAGELHPRARLSNDDVLVLRELAIQGSTSKELATYFGIDRRYARKIIAGRARKADQDHGRAA